MNEHKEEIKVLGHEAEPGYKNIFYIVFVIAVVYLIITMVAS